MERHGRPVVTLFSAGESFAEGANSSLGDEAARHARVRRVEHGDAVRLIDGEGRVAVGAVVSMAKDDVTIAVERVMQMPRPQPLEVIVPVADRDRMLLAAEKCVELQVTAWRPAYFARSRSVSPRGEGPKFHEKVRARMRSALEQSGGTWMPEIAEEVDGVDALKNASQQLNRLLLDVDGAPLPGLVASVPIVVAVGPEGGFERTELDVATASGWRLASVATTTLRFETALIAAAAVIRATQLNHRSS